MTLHVRTLDHVTLVVADLEASRRFYVEVLGMREVPRPAFSFGGLWFQAGGTQIHLILEHDKTGPAGPGAGDQPRTSRANHFAFQVDDAFKAFQWLEQCEVPIIGGPQRRPDGAVQVFTLDPDGYMVELCSPPKPHDEPESTS